MKRNGTSAEDEKTSLESCTSLLNSSQTPKYYTYVNQGSQQNSDKNIAPAQLFDPLETAVKTAKKDDLENEEKNDDKQNEDKDDKDNVDYKEHQDTAKVETNIDMESIMDAVQKLSKESSERKTITFLDFAGQSIYYAFHQIYLSPETFSILVVDMKKNPNDKCEPNVKSNNEIRCSRFETWTYEGNKIYTTIYML